MAFPGTYNFNYYRGDTNQFIIRPKNANGESFSLTGYTADYFVANRRGATGTQYEANAVVDTVNNIVTCTITPSVGRTIPAGTYVYDVQINTSGNAQVYTLLTGTITVTDDITGAV